MFSLRPTSNVAEITFNATFNSSLRRTPTFPARLTLLRFVEPRLPQVQDPFYDVHKGVLLQGDAEVPVAIKILRTSMDEEKITSMREHYLREISTQEFLGPDYPYITEVMGTATVEGKPAIVMRWYTNGDAAQYTGANSHTPVESIIGIVQGVKYFHTKSPRLVHGDLKPSNIVVDDNGRVLISGLGSAHVPGSTEFTTGQISTAFRWMAPELLHEDDRPPTPTFQSDMWALGCTIAQLISGKVPYQSRRYTPQVIPMIAKGVLPYNKARFTEAADMRGVIQSEELWQVLERCWELDPTRRPTITQFEASLQGVFGVT
ncbi:hypothetical protein JAAARDRAFT_31376 [Jaapia argillacea MUCL 33604]|uniref:Protein kinase domain-containing protein n=1 Tax=Jaapia argillacea MUCL 33604 TaxID=933084 RepID=A0A067QH24_9AGAM|nr:hypothetical protein JAAARDRAFT_31376 [Jaapia argillacea MUCL 33604]